VHRESNLGPAGIAGIVAVNLPAIEASAAAAMQPFVFISHSSQDRRIAGRVCEALEQRGLACWLASRDIGPGENFQEAIVKAIRSVRAMVLVFTGSANNSDEIKKEIALASQNHLAVIPLRVEDVLPSDAFLYELSTRQWIDAFDDWDRAMARLAEQISVMAGAAAAAPAQAPGAVAQLRRRRPVMLASAAVIAAAGLFVYLGRDLAAPAVTKTAPAASRDISGKWVSGSLANPYDRNQKSVLHFEFEQSGESLFGTVREKSDFGGGARGIQGGQIKGDGVVFYTQGLTTAGGGGEQPYKDQYRGTLKGGEIEFVRQNDVASGGLPQKFTAKRE
jgi:hypothetical protein